jgi:hypothetical protein
MALPFDNEEQIVAAEGGAASPRASAAGGATVTNRAPHKYRSGYISRFLQEAIDSVYLSYAGEINPTWDGRLEELKALAQSKEEGDRAQAQAQIADHMFEVRDKAAAGRFCVLVDNAFRIELSRARGRPLAYVQVSSEFLCHVGPAAAEEQLAYVIRTLGRVDGRPTVSRIDPCVDFQSELAMDSWGADAWVTRAHLIEPHWDRRIFSGWSIGRGGDVSVRLYNKLLEVMTKRKGAHVFEVWNAAGWDPTQPVWRLEGQVRREALKQLGLRTLDETLANLQGLWWYVTQDWLRLCVPDADDANRARWRLHPLWEELSAANWGRPDQPRLKRFRNTRAPADEKLFGPSAGYIQSYMAREGIESWEEGIRRFMADQSRFLRDRAVAKGKTLAGVTSDRVAEKRRRFNTGYNAARSPERLDQIESYADAYRRAKDRDGDANV